MLKIPRCRSRRGICPYAGFMLAVVLYACANVVSPTGGPRDEDPPEVIRSTPPNFSTNFQGGRIRIHFDEFVELRNIRQQLLVSPPLDEMPEVSIRGRSIIMDIEEELRPNTTYNFFFGDAIRDITEGNAIPNFQFVFSTGDYVDSLSISGQVNNAFNLQPEEGVYVMLYSNVFDSVPYLERPAYLAKTDKDGQFFISNMASGEYLIFALDDRNNNFLYDMPGERIAFLDSLVKPQYVPVLRHDPEEPDEEAPGQETEAMPGQAETSPTGMDAEIGHRDASPDAGLPGYGTADVTHYQLFMFEEKDTVQRVVSSALLREGLIQIAFRVPFDSAHVREIRQELEKPWHIPEFGKNRDTLKLWFADLGLDSLYLEVLDGHKVLDTIRRATRPRRVRERSEDEEAFLKIGFDFRRPAALPFFRPLAITSEHPVQELDTARMELYIHDTIPMPADFRFSGHVRRRVELNTPLEEETSYRITVLPGAFTDIFGLSNDTLSARLGTTSRENYGNFILRLDLPPAGIQYILQLLDRNEMVLEEKIVEEPGTYTFRHLAAGIYRARLIEDLAGSGKWNTGNYLRKLQPEPVHMLSDTIRIRENWDVELPWVISPAGGSTSLPSAP